ncbi:EVE domain-containing protein [Paenibacillus lautus]|uniref:EVE domain-containing protein n=1 Tax=Paenibacillus lautus TaxID=1401 RepID=UPI0035315FBA
MDYQDMLDRLEERTRYWIGVVSESHVKLGVEGGFAQLCHGKSAPLRRMREGDWLIYYSPRTNLKSGEALQAFTAMGQVVNDHVYEYHMTASFVPFRRDIRYVPSQEVKIARLLDRLSFTRGNRNWGYAFRYGHFEIKRGDFLVIAEAMLGGSDIIQQRSVKAL